MLTPCSVSPWIPTLGIEYHLAADGISLTLILLTGIIAIAGILFSWNIEERAKEFFAFYLLLIGAVYGVFLSYDLFLLFVFYEIVIIPKYFLIAIWGSTRREYGAMKLALYSFVGSAMVLIGLIAAYVVAGAKTTSLSQLAQFPFSSHFQLWAFPLVFVGFAILAGMWPLHTWAPTGHVAAPTAASMLLAGVVMKLGAYGCLRVAMVLFPLGMGPWGFHVLRPRFVARRLCIARSHRDYLWRAGRSGTEGLQIRHRLLQHKPHGIYLAWPDDLESDWNLRRSTADVLAWHTGRPALRRRRAHGLCAHSYPRPCDTERHESLQSHSLCRCHLCHCRDGQHGLAWIQRVCRGVDDPDRRLARLSLYWLSAWDSEL
jgi:hypothetical protein